MGSCNANAHGGAELLRRSASVPLPPARAVDPHRETVVRLRRSCESGAWTHVTRACRRRSGSGTLCPNRLRRPHNSLRPRWSQRERAARESASSRDSRGCASRIGRPLHQTAPYAPRGRTRVCFALVVTRVGAIAFGHWCLVICWSLGLGHWGLDGVSPGASAPSS